MALAAWEECSPAGVHGGADAVAVMPAHKGGSQLADGQACVRCCIPWRLMSGPDSTCCQLQLKSEAHYSSDPAKPHMLLNGRERSQSTVGVGKPGLQHGPPGALG